MNASLQRVFGPLWRAIAGSKAYDIGLHIGLERLNLMQMQPGAAGPAEKISMGYPSAIQCIQQSLSNRFLPNDVTKCLGTPFTIKYLRHFTTVYYTLSRRVSQKNFLVLTI